MMKTVIFRCLVAGSLAATAHAGYIDVYLSAQATVSSPPSSVQQNPIYDETTGLLTPTTYSAVASNGGGSSTSTATVSMGSLHSYSYSTFPLDGTTSYSEGYVDIFTDDLGVTPAGVTSLTGSFTLTGTTSPIPSGAPYAIESVVYYTLIDVDNGNSDTKYARMFYDLQNPADDVFSATLSVNPGDRVEESLEFEISTYQAGNAAESAAFIDYTDTMNYYVDTGVPGEDFVSNTGHDFSSSAATTPEPGTWGLMGMGAILLAAVRPRKKSALAGQISPPSMRLS
jgi:PEP-CTERM motif